MDRSKRQFQQQDIQSMMVQLSSTIATSTTNENRNRNRNGDMNDVTGLDGKLLVELTVNMANDEEYREQW